MKVIKLISFLVNATSQPINGQKKSLIRSIFKLASYAPGIIQIWDSELMIFIKKKKKRK